MCILFQWTLYRNPKDYPGKLVLRRIAVGEARDLPRHNIWYTPPEARKYGPHFQNRPTIICDDTKKNRRIILCLMERTELERLPALVNDDSAIAYTWW